MKLLRPFLMIFCLLFIAQGLEKVWGDGSSEKILANWIKKTNQKLPPKIRSYFEFYINEVALLQKNQWKSQKEFDAKFGLPDSKIPMRSMDLKSALGLHVASVKMDRNDKSITLTNLYSVKVDGVESLIAFYGRDKDCNSIVLSIYFKTAKTYTEVFSEQAKYDCLSKVHIAALSDKGPYFYHFFNQTSATTVNEIFFPLVSGLPSAKPLVFSIWHGGVYFKDFDGDGKKEIISGLREYGNPPEIEKQLDDYYGITKYTIYKWNNTKFDKLGDYYSRQMAPGD